MIAKKRRKRKGGNGNISRIIRRNSEAGFRAGTHVLRRFFEISAAFFQYLELGSHPSSRASLSIV